MERAGPARVWVMAPALVANAEGDAGPASQIHPAIPGLGVVTVAHWKLLSVLKSCARLGAWWRGRLVGEGITISNLKDGGAVQLP